MLPVDTSAVAKPAVHHDEQSQIPGSSVSHAPPTNNNNNIGEATSSSAALPQPITMSTSSSAPAMPELSYVPIASSSPKQAPVSETREAIGDASSSHAVNRSVNAPFDGGNIPFDGGNAPFDGVNIPFDGGNVPQSGAEKRDTPKLSSAATAAPAKKPKDPSTKKSGKRKGTP